MTSAGREPLHAECEVMSDVETIASNYLAENSGDPHRALRRVVSDALADLLEVERRSRRSERLISRGYVRGRLSEGSKR
jgi:hypothetical protein